MTVLSSMIVATFLVALVVLSYPKGSAVRTGVSSGTTLWATCLPIMATLGFGLVILGNLLLPQKAVVATWDVKTFFSFPELLILLVLSAFYTTRLGQSLAALCTSLILLRVGFRPITLVTSGLGVSLLLACSVTVFILGDLLPWLSPNGQHHRSGHILRAVMLVFLWALSIGMTLMALARLPELCAWLARVGSTHLSPSLASALLGTMLVGWTLVALRQRRQGLLFLLALPTLGLFSFFVGWTAPYLAALLTLMATLALAPQERRLEPRLTNHSGNRTMVLGRNHLG